MLSLKTQYALVALVALTTQSRVVQSRIISRHYDIPHDYLEQVLLTLKKGGFCQSTRGKNGGYQLSRSADYIIISDVITYLEGAWSVPTWNNKIINAFYKTLSDSMKPVMTDSLARFAMRYEPKQVYSI